MGLFKSRYKTHVGTVVARVIDDEKLPESAKAGLISALFGDGEIVENILEQAVNSIGVRAESMYKYAKQSYTHGLPSSTILSSNKGEAVVLGVIQAQVGAGAEQRYHHFGPLNRLHYGWYILCKDKGYDSSTNELTVLSEALQYKCYLKDMVVVVGEATLAELDNGSLDHWGIPPTAGGTPVRISTKDVQTSHTPFVVDNTVSGDHLRVTYVWEVPTQVTENSRTFTKQVLNEYAFTIPVDDYVNPATGLMSADYFQVQYSLNGQDGYWLYRLGSNANSQIEAVFNTSKKTTGEFLPISYFQYNHVKETSTSTGYATSKKMFNKLGIDYDAMLKAVHDNPNIGTIEQAMMMFAVPANTTKTLEQRYLFDFFSKFHDDSGAIGMTPSRSMAALEVLTMLDEAKPNISMVIQDSRFKMSLSCLGMSKQLLPGNIGVEGTYTSGLVIEKVIRSGTTGYATTEGPSVDMINWEVPVSRHYYRKQISGNIYQEIQIFGMKMTYHIYGQYNTIGDDGDDILLIPLDYALTKDYSITDKEKLYSRSLHYVFNTKVLQEIKWYQTGVFKFFMVVVMVAIAIYTYGAFIKEQIAIMSGMTVQAIAIMLAKGILGMVVMNIGIKLFVKAVGFKVAIIVAIAAALVGLGLGFESGSITGAPWAQELIQLSNGLISGAQADIGNMMNGLQKEALSFGAYAKEQTERLEAAQELLDQKTWLVPYTFLGESPQAFYTRSFIGNPGALAFDAMHSYYDVSLRLPTPNQTL